MNVIAAVVVERSMTLAAFAEMNVDEFRFILWLPFASGVLEVADQFLLLGIDGDEWNAAFETVRRLRVDVLELRVPI